MKRTDDVRSTVLNTSNIPVTIFANKDVPMEDEGIEQLLDIISLQDTLNNLGDWQEKGLISPFWESKSEQGKINSIVVTPDFHKGGGIPVGVVINAEGFIIPSAVGNDVACGMRLLTTDVSREELSPKVVESLGHKLRSIFFKGQRDIPMSPRQRESLLRNGLLGLNEDIGDNAGTGLWQYYSKSVQFDDLQRTHFGGGLSAKDIFGFADYIKSSGNSDGRDPQIGSVGGGNHFVELQTVDEVCDGRTAYEWGLKKDSVTIMAHSGSLGLGHMVGGHFCGKAHSLYPNNMPHPKHGFYVLPSTGPNAKLAVEYLDAMRNAANFAFANRLCLGLMAIRALSETLGRDIETKLVYDAPHNLVWEPENHTFGNNCYLHRKGACPAIGATLNGVYGYTGAPVIIPGSIGASSYVLAGEGSDEALQSACHGAGRSLTRGQAGHVSSDVYDRDVRLLKVISAIDPESPQVRGRQDILSKYRQRLMEEAPGAYKGIGPVVETVENANIARRVARLWPLMTVKG